MFERNQSESNQYVNVGTQVNINTFLFFSFYENTYVGFSPLDTDHLSFSEYNFNLIKKNLNITSNFI